MKEKDIPFVVELHSGYIPGALFPKLGNKFMHALYHTMIDMDCAVNYVWEIEVEDCRRDVPVPINEGRKSGAPKHRGEDKESEARTVAFITATTDSSVLFRQVLIKNFPLFVWRTFLYLMGNPLRIREVWETVTYSKLAKVPDVTAELLFIAIDKNFRKKSISDDLVNKCLQWAKEKGHNKIKVTTYTTNHGANTLLERLGFKCARKEPFRDKEINLYVHNL